jgi:hypothetical protein
METARPRVLIYEPEKALAETILRGIEAIPGIAPEIDVSFSLPSAVEAVRDRRYDLLVVGLRRRERMVRALDGRRPPVIAVGGRPNGRPGRNGDSRRVPLPLSFNLLRQAVRSALDGEDETRIGRTETRDSASG